LSAAGRLAARLLDKYGRKSADGYERGGVTAEIDLVEAVREKRRATQERRTEAIRRVRTRLGL
jgi:hypothetical protein